MEALGILLLVVIGGMYGLFILYGLFCWAALKIDEFNRRF